jgi:aldose 1-epimerase
MKLMTLLLLWMWALTSCQPAGENMRGEKATENPAIKVADWGMTDGQPVKLFTLSNSKGVSVSITNYGGTITSWVVPDKHGNKGNIVIGFDSLKGYQGNQPYFGATIGRYANRICNARFRIDTIEYQLAANNGANHLHGGIKGFDQVVWEAQPADSGASLTLSYLSKDGEEGYPGNLQVTVIFTLTEQNEVLIDYMAETDKPTPVNLTNHSYFNLSGGMGNTILQHQLQINADEYTPVDTGLIPTGELKAVKGTPFDFLSPHFIGERIEQVSGGYDHNFVLNREGNRSEPAAVLTDSLSGRQLQVFTTEPGLQFYSGNFLDGSIKTSDGKPIPQHGALCLETQHFPDSPNKPQFPGTILQPGEKYHSVTKYKVSLMH